MYQHLTIDLGKSVLKTSFIREEIRWQTCRLSLPYTEAVLMEAQRCSTIAPFVVPHYAVKDTNLQGYTIPKVRKYVSYNTSK